MCFGFCDTQLVAQHFGAHLFRLDDALHGPETAPEVAETNRARAREAAAAAFEEDERARVNRERAEANGFPGRAFAGDARVGSRRFFSTRTSSFSSFPFSRAGEHVEHVEGAFRRTASPEVDRGSPRKSTSTKCATRHSRATACVTYVSRVSGCFRINAKSSFSFSQ